MSKFNPHQAHRRDHTETSRNAALSMVEAAPRHGQLILETLRRHGPMTAQEIERHTNLDYWQISRRLKELRDAERIADTGECRATRSGRPAIVYEAVAKQGALF